MIIDFEINEKRKILWVSWENQYAWGGDIVGYINKNNNKLLSRKQYEEMIEREVYEKWYSSDIEEIINYNDFDEFRKSILDNPELDFEPLVEVVLSDYDDIDYDDIEMYNPYIEMHWLEILSLENEKSIYQIAKKGGLTSSTLYSIIDRDTQLCDISVETLNKILKGLDMSIFEFINKYDGRLF